MRCSSAPRWRGAALIAAVTLIVAVSADVALADLGPVAPKVLAAVNASGSEFVLAPHGHPRIGKREAVRDALQAGPWNGCATGISLARISRDHAPSIARALVWLVSVHPNQAVRPIAPPRRHGHSSTRARMNVFVVTVSASRGEFLIASARHTSALPAWQKAPPPGCVGLRPTG